MIKSFLIIVVALTLHSYSRLKAQNIGIIPNPKEVVVGKGTFTVSQQISIVSSTESISAASALQSHINQIMGYRVDIIDSVKLKTNAILFKHRSNIGKEAYELNVSKEAIQIIASNKTGWFYGVQSLIQLFPEYTGSSPVSTMEIPSVKIKDAPRFSWRAFMLDEARFFKGAKQVKLLLDEMAHLKMNVFHWHLTDDQGWRIEIKKYPRLTQIGSKRKSTQIGPLKWDSPIQSAEPHEGFYTQQEIKEIVEYAKERHITILPEIEMPGHCNAAIAAYPWLGTTKEQINVPINFGGIINHSYDVSDPKVYQFLTGVLDEVMALFPSQVIHIGGDEVKYNHWNESVSIQNYMKEQKLETPAELQVFFTNRISQYLESKDKRMMGWNEIMGHDVHSRQDKTDTKLGQELAKGTIIHFWTGNVELATSAARNNYDIVNSLSSNTYLDYSYDDIPLSKAYAFDPIPEKLDPEFHDKVLGLGCQMWGEWIPTNGQMYFMVFPRIAAYAEVGWTEKDNKNFDNFKVSLRGLQKRWKQKGIYYAPNSVVEMNEIDNN